MDEFGKKNYYMLDFTLDYHVSERDQTIQNNRLPYQITNLIETEIEAFKYNAKNKTQRSLEAVYKNKPKI